MKIYLRKIDDQCINKQISYPKDILNEFLDGKGEKDKILCEGLNSHHKETVSLLLATDPRFDNGIKRVLGSEGQMESGDIMVMYKHKDKYVVELVKKSDLRHDSLSILFSENDRHLLTNLDDFVEEENLSYDELISTFKTMLNTYEKVLAIHLFGIKYGKQIRKNNYSIKKIISDVGINDSYFAEINKGIKLSGYVKEYKTENIDYFNFQQLLKWFVNQLNVNNNLIDGQHITGFGYRGDSIRDNYLDWRHYSSFDLDISIQSGYNSTSFKANYIHNRDSEVQLSIRPIFSEETKYVEALQIAYFKDKDTPLELIDNTYSINDLQLDSEEISDLLKELFDKFSDKLKEYISRSSKTIVGYNKVFYGAPGCGKSYFVENILLPSLEIEKNDVVRITFYQDYSNTDFIGQILPKIKKEIKEGKEITSVEYLFNPGPFTLALKKALEYPNKPVALVIEELNRGPAASIFGDIFQLLDRKEDGSSVYEITNVNIQDYLQKELAKEYEKIRIPNNLFIIATMNTSDQNVFTLDTAFKRRWKFEKIKNEFNGTAHDNWFVPGMIETTWKELVNTINDYIIANADELMNEDKQIGVYFIDENGLVEKKVDAKNPDKIKEFSFKMLEYLWDDVAKFNRQDWFKDAKTLDQLLENYINNNGDVFSKDLTDSLNEHKSKSAEIIEKEEIKDEE